MVTDALEEYDHAGCTIALYYDDDAMSPREWDQLGTIISWGRASFVGDESTTYEPYDTDYSTARWAVRIRREREATVVIPLRFNDYRASGSELVVAQSWDDANAVILDTPRGREMCWGTPAPTREQTRDALEAEVEEMNTYLHGEVYGWAVEADGITIDSCWGFMGDDGLREAKNQAESRAEDEERAESVVGFYALPH